MKLTVSPCAAIAGMGRSIALRLAKDGFSVAINDLPSQKDVLVDLQAHIRAEYCTNDAGQDCIVTVGDVSSEEDVKHMVDEAVEQLGSLDVVSPHSQSLYALFELVHAKLVANAGICPFWTTFVDSKCIILETF